MTATPSGPTSDAPASSPVASEGGASHRAAIRALPPGLVPLEVLLSLVRDDVPGVARRAYRAPWTEREESSARSCSTPRTRSSIIDGVRR